MTATSKGVIFKCDYCYKESEGFKETEVPWNWGCIHVDVQVGCPEEGIPLSLEERIYHICDGCLKFMDNRKLEIAKKTLLEKKKNGS